jgi:hypothetical protein
MYMNCRDLVAKFRASVQRVFRILSKDEYGKGESIVDESCVKALHVTQSFDDWFI